MVLKFDIFLTKTLKPLGTMEFIQEELNLLECPREDKLGRNTCPKWKLSDERWNGG